MAKIIKEDSALGATIADIDLKQPLDEKLTAFIAKALAENEVIFFRNQDITPEPVSYTHLTLPTICSV